MLGSSGSPTPYQLPIKLKSCAVAAAALTAAATMTGMMRNRFNSNPGRAVGKFELLHPVPDKDIALRIETNAPFIVRKQNDLVFRRRIRRIAVDPVRDKMLDIALNRPGAAFGLITDIIAAVAFAEFLSERSVGAEFDQ